MMPFGQPANTGTFIKDLFLGKNILSRLILINTFIFLVINILGQIFWLFGLEPAGVSQLGFIGKYLALPSNLAVLATIPWTLLTYMFTQEGFFHLLFNMIMLYFGSKIFLEYLNERKLLSTYIIGGLVGAFFFVGAFNVFPVFQNVNNDAVAIGSSASVLAIFIAIATYVPDYTVHLFLFGRLKMKYIAIAFIAIDLLSIQHGNPGGHIAHLGGALWGFLYAFQLKKGHNLYGFLAWFKKPSGSYRQYSMRSSAKRSKKGRPLSDVEYNSQRIATQEQIDHILDKISKSGYSSLTAQEKELLFKTSNKK